MRKIISLILTILLTLGLHRGQDIASYGQSRSTLFVEFGKYKSYVGKYPEVFINYELKGIIPVQSKPDGGVLIAKLRNNPEKSYNAFLLKKHGDMFLVAIFDSLDKEFIAYGWIDKKYLGISLKKDYSPLILYASHDEQSEKREYYLKYASNYILEISDFFKTWLKITIRIGENSYSGWIPEDFQWANVWTTCC